MLSTTNIKEELCALRTCHVTRTWPTWLARAKRKPYSGTSEFKIPKSIGNSQQMSPPLTTRVETVVLIATKQWNIKFQLEIYLKHNLTPRERSFQGEIENLHLETGNSFQCDKMSQKSENLWNIVLQWPHLLDPHNFGCTKLGKWSTSLVLFYF